MSTHHKYPLLFFRAEKEKSQYFSELNDLRASTNHLANDKVEESFSSKLEVVSLKMQKKNANFAVIGKRNFFLRSSCVTGFSTARKIHKFLTFFKILSH